MSDNFLKINSNEYWDQRFEEDWETYEGHQQTEFFVNLLVKNLPDWIKQDFLKSTVCDAGCAEGQGTVIFKNNFPEADVEGIDFSEIAIEKAKTMYPSINFFKDDVYNLKNKYDTIFISNVLEHFENPFEVVEKLLSNTEKNLIIMVPFQELELLKEHFFRFDYDSFPIKLTDFTLSYFKEIDCRVLENSLWRGKQAIIIYTKNTFNKSYLDSINLLKTDNAYLNDIDSKLRQQDLKIQELSDWGTELSSDSILKDTTINNLTENSRKKLKEKDSTILELTEKIKEVSEWGTTLENSVKEKDRIILDLTEKIKEVSEWGISLDKTVRERDSLILELNQKIQEVSEWAKMLQKNFEN